MSRERPLSLCEILTAELRAARPDSDPERPDLRSLRRTVHALDSPLRALCISGGGIRSATFGLGVIQGLAERGLLGEFDYVSTVSGGGYIGSWLTAWVHRAGGIDAVVPRLRRDAPPAPPGEAEPVSHLRDYNSYLSPRRGLLSFDSWTLVATVLRNVLLNWMVFLPLLLAILMVPRIFLATLAIPELLFGDLIFAGGGRTFELPQLDVISTSPWIAFGLPALSVSLFAMALFNIFRYLPGVGNRPHSGGDYLGKVLAPLIVAVFALLAHDSLFYLGRHYSDTNAAWTVILWTIVPAIAALVGFLVFAARGGPLERLRLLLSPLTLGVGLMAAGTGAATWLTLNFVLWNPDPTRDLSWPMYVTLGPPLILIGFALGTVLFMGLASTHLTDEDREWMSRSSAGVLLFCIVWLSFCAIVLLVPGWVLDRELWARVTLAITGALGAGATVFGGAFAANGSKLGRKLRRVVASLVGTLAPVLFAASLVVGLSILTNLLVEVTGPLLGMPVLGLDGSSVQWRDHLGILTRSYPLHLVLLAAVFLVASWIMAHFVDINTFSLHGMYRDRLVRAYLGASNSERRTSRFTGFARNDDLPMRVLDPSRKPFQIVNLTLNLLSSERLAWQQRKAQSFTVSPLHSGAAGLGYRPSARYGGRHGITLGTALAISGAAASPSMGYHSSPVVGFIMTLFNARLGAWLGNPGPAGARTWTDSSPRSALRSLAKEAFGLTSSRGEYAYYSDGGHFENLALYEMIRRRCGTIVLLDAGCDPDFSFADLGNALRKIRIDLGVPISFDEKRFARLREREARCAVAEIDYSAQDGPCENGRLVYIKPMLRGNEPPDVVSYHATHEEFPHQATSDQWFDESQTESYRILGLSTIDELCAEWEGGSLEDLHDHLLTRYLATEAPAPPPES